MSTDEFQALWKAYDTKLERTMDMNKRLLEEVRMGKVRKSFGWLIVSKAVMIVWCILWNVMCGTLAWRFRTEPFFVAAAVISILVTSLTICGYVVQLLLLVQINMSKTILGTQKQLAQLEAVIVGTYRLSILQAPVWTFVFLNRQMMAGMGMGLWIMQGCITGLFIVGVIWLYRKISMKNIHKRWMQNLVKGVGVQQIARARDFIKEIGEYGKE